MFDSNSFVEDRIRKIAELRAMGVDPYPVPAYSPTYSIPKVLTAAETLITDQTALKIAGRVIGMRPMGKAVFIDLLDDAQKLQLYVRESNIDQATWKMLALIDLGDFMGAVGSLFRTRTGELTLKATAMTVLGKPSHYIPLSKRCDGAQFNAITDKGVLYRQRHLDLLMNTDSRTIFLKRSRIIRGIRRYLDDEGFVEVETPILGLHYSGAAAKPFVTRINALDQQQMYLRISPECALKRLLCGGLNKVYELGKNFRNEGIDANHNPEFTMLEFYEAFTDYQRQMERFETLVARLSEEINGTTRIAYHGRPLDLTPPWRRMPMVDGLRNMLGMDVDNIPVEGFPEIFQKYHPEGVAALPEPLTWGSAVVELFEKLVEPDLWNPVFVMDHPVEVSPLTKKHRNNPKLVERFEPMIAGMEVGNAYTELNDPIEQYERLVSQQVARDQAYDLDDDFVQAIAHGMPPAGGTGMGVDRIVMILTGAGSIRDVVFFPFVSRPRVNHEDVSPEMTAPKERKAMNSTKQIRYETQTITAPVLVQAAGLDGVSGFIASLKGWVEDVLPDIERGVIRVGADPVELVMLFEPWLTDAKQMIGPVLAALSAQQSHELSSTLGLVIDAIEHVYAASGQAPVTGWGRLDGLDDLLVALSFCSSKAPCMER